MNTDGDWKALRDRLAAVEHERDMLLRKVELLRALMEARVVVERIAACGRVLTSQR